MVNLFQTLYDLLNTYIFGGLAESGNYYDLICILVSTIGNLFLIALPFICIFKVVRMVVK